MLLRFKMDGCHYCKESQDDWDNLCEQAKPKLTPESTIAEIDSDFTDDFLNELNPMTEEGTPLKVQGYPTYIVIVDGTAKTHDGRKTDELMETLINHQMIHQEGGRRRSRRRRSRKSSRRR